MNNETDFTQMVAGNVRAAMSADGKQIGDLAGVIGVSRTTAGKRYRGVIEFWPSDLNKIAKWLGYDARDFLSEDFRINRHSALAA